MNDNDGTEDEESPAEIELPDIEVEESPAEIELPGIPEVREVGPSQSVGRRKRMNLEGVVERLHTEKRTARKRKRTAKRTSFLSEGESPSSTDEDDEDKRKEKRKPTRRKSKMTRKELHDNLQTLDC